MKQCTSAGPPSSEKAAGSDGGLAAWRPGGPYGPPGTGKTTYVRKVAEYLGWPLVVLDPSVFAQEGLPLIATVASRVFSQLLELEDTVIFFDEMEALMYTRSDAGAASSRSSSPPACKRSRSSATSGRS